MPEDLISKTAIVLDDRANYQEQLRQLLESIGLAVIVVSSVAQLMNLGDREIELVTLDGNVDAEGDYGERTMEYIDQIRLRFPHALLIVISDDSSSLKIARSHGLSAFDKSPFSGRDFKNQVKNLFNG